MTGVIFCSGLARVGAGGTAAPGASPPPPPRGHEGSASALSADAEAGNGLSPARTPFSRRMYASSSEYVSSLREPGRAGGIEVLVFVNSASGDWSPHFWRKSIPDSGGANAPSSRFAPWHDAQCSTYPACPRSACAAVNPTAVALGTWAAS